MSHRTPLPASPDLIERIKREIAVPGFVRDLTIWTERQVGKLLAIEQRVDPNRASELVNDAIVATCDGVRRWDPSARTLRRHFEQTINSWLWHECERSRRRRHIALDTVSVDDSQDETPSIDIEMSLRREDPRTRPDGLFAQYEVRAKVLDTLRASAVDDSGVIALIASHEAGYHREGEVCERLDLTENRHRAVVRRLKTLCAHVPGSLRSDVRDLISRDGGAPIATVARHRGRTIEIAVDELAANSADSLAALCTSSEGSDDGENAERDAA